MPSLNNYVGSQIIDYVNSFGGNFNQWYVGIAEDPRSRLFNDHNVVMAGQWIYDQCYTASDARLVENYLLQNYGFQGDTGGGSDLTSWVYAYRITNTTQP